MVANSDHRIAIFDLGQQKWRTLVSMERPYRPTLSRDGRFIYFKPRVNKEAIFRVRIALSQIGKTGKP